MGSGAAMAGAEASADKVTEDCKSKFQYVMVSYWIATDHGIGVEQHDETINSS